MAEGHRPVKARASLCCRTPVCDPSSATMRFLAIRLCRHALRSGRGGASSPKCRALRVLESCTSLHVDRRHHRRQSERLFSSSHHDGRRVLRPAVAGVIFHVACSSTYTAQGSALLCAKLDIRQSMGSAGSCFRQCRCRIVLFDSGTRHGFAG